MTSAVQMPEIPKEEWDKFHPDEEDDEFEVGTKLKLRATLETQIIEGHLKALNVGVESAKAFGRPS